MACILDPSVKIEMRLFWLALRRGEGPNSRSGIFIVVGRAALLRRRR
jgi:hypothetical protein